MVFNFRKRLDVHVAKTTSSGKPHGMHTICKLGWMKIWKQSRQVCWTKITIIYNLKNVYQTKDIQPWSESLKNVEVWVIKKSFDCTLAHNSCKSTTENFDCHVIDVVLKFLSTRPLSAFPCCGYLRISSSWICGDDCWPLSLAGTKYLSIRFIFRIFGTLMVFCGW